MLNNVLTFEFKTFECVSLIPLSSHSWFKSLNEHAIYCDFGWKGIVKKKVDAQKSRDKCVRAFADGQAEPI